MKEEISCGVVVFRNDMILLLKKQSNGHWGFPKGHDEDGETEIETATRETQEESGISDLKFIPGFKETIKYNYKAGVVSRDKTVHFFLAETQTKDIVISNEHEDFLWLPFEEALERITYDEEKEILRKAVDHLKNHKS